MKIVITDASTVTNGDLDLRVFEQFGELYIYPMTRGTEQTAQRLADADAVLLNKTVINEEVLAHAPHLKYIGLFATGYNVIDLAACKRRGITVCNAGSYSTAAVAQTVFGFLLNHYCRTAQYDAFVKEGGWIDSPTFSPFVYQTYELQGKTIGIVGYGAIGKAVADIALAFGMRGLVYNRSPKEDARVRFVPLDTLLAQSDIVTVHCPLNADSERLFCRETFLKMKDQAYFINTARGGVVVEEDLRWALGSGKLSGAGVDVISVEPMLPECPLRGAKNITFTPHVAWAPLQTRQRLLDIVCDCLASYLRGEKKNVIA